MEHINHNDAAIRSERTASFLLGLTPSSEARLQRILCTVLKQSSTDKDLPALLDFLKNSTRKFHWKQWKMAIQMTNSMLEKLDDYTVELLLRWAPKNNWARMGFRRLCKTHDIDISVKLGVYDNVQRGRDQYRQTLGKGKTLDGIYELRYFVLRLLTSNLVCAKDREYLIAILDRVNNLTESRRYKFKQNKRK